VSRVLCALAIAAGALLPLSAAATPSPSPSLAQVLAPPPSGYSEVGTAKLHGRFDAIGYTDSFGTRATEAENTLIKDGFVDGYGMTWIQQSSGHALIEFVIAFAGGSGAKSWLHFEEASDKSHADYQHSDSISGIDTYYGVHLADPTGTQFLDGFSFIKGNDMFGVGFYSAKDDVLNLATNQTKSQYDSAPGSTIPPSQWPENAKANSSQGAPFPLGDLIGGALASVVIAGLVVLAVAWQRRSPRRPSPPAPGWAAVQLSPDGRFWWDGQAWKDSRHEAPPFAQRSNDGLYWWDGLKWRTVPFAPGSHVR